MLIMAFVAGQACLLSFGIRGISPPFFGVVLLYTITFEHWHWVSNATVPFFHHSMLEQHLKGWGEDFMQIRSHYRYHCSGKMALLTATPNNADQAPRLPILGVVVEKLSLHAKTQPNLSINAVRADFLGFLVPILDLLISHKILPPFYFTFKII